MGCGDLGRLSCRALFRLSVVQSKRSLWRGAVRRLELLARPGLLHARLNLV